MDRMPRYRGRNTIEYIGRVLDNTGTAAKLLIPSALGIAGGYLLGAAVDSLGTVGTVQYLNDVCHGAATLIRAVGVIGGIGFGIGLAYADIRDRADRARHLHEEDHRPERRRRR